MVGKPQLQLVSPFANFTFCLTSRFFHALLLFAFYFAFVLQD